MLVADRVDQAGVFPACAGMNRERKRRHVLARSVPRVRGDEPNSAIVRTIQLLVFPACAGMNRPSADR